MLTLPWRSFAAAERDGEHLAMLSYFVLEGPRALPRFSWNALRVGRQLARSDGLIGYSVGARLGRLEFLALSVWDDERALQQFVREKPHRSIMEAMRPHVAQAGFVRWMVGSASLPPGWREAHEHRARQER